MAIQTQNPAGQALPRSVEAAGAILKRWYLIERASMHALAGRLPGIGTQEIKSLAARHLWMDSVSADKLRTRILELRSPRRDVDRKGDPALIRLMQAALNAPDELCFVGGLMRVVNAALEDAYRQAAAHANLIDDAPTSILLRHLLDYKRTQRDEMLPVLADAEKRNPSGSATRAEWEEYLRALLAACGGVNGTQPTGPLPESPLEKPFARPTSARRDPRYRHACELIGHSPLFWQSEDVGNQWVGYAIAHFNELWASEMAAAVLYRHPDAPWNLLLDAARWCYDEMRHFQLGLTRLEKAGLDIYEDVPAPDTITFDCYEPDFEKLRLLAVHGFERGGVVGGGKQAAMKWHRQVGDDEGSRHFDFDWADESIHLQYGVEWLRHLYGEEILDTGLDERITQAIAHRGRLITEMFTTEGPAVEEHYRRLCRKARAPVMPPAAPEPALVASGGD